jgi:hypothetical protein
VVIAIGAGHASAGRAMILGEGAVFGPGIVCPIGGVSGGDYLPGRGELLMVDVNPIIYYGDDDARPFRDLPGRSDINLSVYLSAVNSGRL